MDIGSGMRTGSLEPLLSSLDESAASRVLSSVHRTAVGNGLQDYVTPLIKDGDPDTRREEVRDHFLSRLTLRTYPWLREAEEAQAAKIGSYSQQLPYVERKANVHAYFAKSTGVPDLDILDQAYNHVKRLMPDELDPVSLTVAINQMPKGTNLGYPFFSNDERLIPSLKRLAAETESNGFKNHPLPALMFFRGQPRGIGEISKNRVVWGISHINIAHGLRVQIPLLHYLRRKIEFASWNALDVVDEAITSAFHHNRKQIVSADFSGYDASLHPELLRYAWNLIRYSFKRSARRMIDWLELQMMTVPLITPEGILTGDHAMPSGDANTNLVDGLAQLLLWNYVALKLGTTVTFVTVQGDDGVVIFGTPLDMATAAEVINADFGMRLSVEKGMESADNVVFLQNNYNRYFVDRNGRNSRVRPICRAVNGMLSYERLVKKSLGWSGYMDTIRWWQQAEACKYHPEFRLLVQYLWENDRYSRLPSEEVLRLAGGSVKVLKALKQPSFPYGKAPLSGLNKFRIVRDLAKLRGESEDQGLTSK